METIKVNMTPCEDIKTIHASQNDNEAREWGFELHNNGDKIDSSSISDQMVFKAYEGGTEQILPTNGSTPTTSPFKGDIKYPQGLLTDQEFTYRESPTESDGLAFVENIKGNTLVWNQNCYSFSALRSTLSSSINSQTDITCTASSGQTSFGIIIRDDTGYFNFIGGHTYLLSMNISEITVNNFSRISPESALNPQTLARETGRYTVICNPTATGTRSILCYLSGTTTTSDKFKFNSVQIVDLTMLNDSRITDYDSFRTYYPLSFYPYNSGSLLSFNGNGIKTVGKNLLPTDLRMTNLYGLNDDKSIYQFNTSSAPFTWSYENSVFRTTLPSGNYKVGFIAKTKATPSSTGLILTDSDNNFLVSRGGSLNNLERGEYSFSLTKTTDLGLCVKVYDGVWWLYIIDAENEMATYEPYTSSTLSLPISTYFPNGMDGVGTDYDELANTKATTRMTRVDLGSLTWIYHSQSGNFYAENAVTGRKVPLGLNAKCAIYQQVNEDTISGVSSLELNNSFAFQTTMPTRIIVRNTSYTDATAFKQAMNGVYLVYPLATPIETEITTASLVTENAEIPLSNEDGVLIGKCTEQLSAEPGFHDAKIKLTDSDGDVYSNKIQLHIERKPS